MWVQVFIHLKKGASNSHARVGGSFWNRIGRGVSQQYESKQVKMSRVPCAVTQSHDHRTEKKISLYKNLHYLFLFYFSLSSSWLLEKKSLFIYDCGQCFFFFATSRRCPVAVARNTEHGSSLSRRCFLQSSSLTSGGSTTDGKTRFSRRWQNAFFGRFFCGKMDGLARAIRLCKITDIELEIIWEQ